MRLFLIGFICTCALIPSVHAQSSDFAASAFHDRFKDYLEVDWLAAADQDFGDALAEAD